MTEAGSDCLNLGGCGLAYRARQRMCQSSAAHVRSLTCM